LDRFEYARAAQSMHRVNQGCACFRPDQFQARILPDLARRVACNHAELNRLGREQTEAIILDVSGSKELPCELQEQIVSKSDGVPLFAEELTKTVLESGLLQDAGDRYVALGPLPPLAVPTTLLGSLTARLDRLGEIREIAQIGAAIGREFSYRLVAAITPISSPSLQTALTHLAAGELIFARGEPPDSTYIFKHALVQDAAYATMVRSKCQHSTVGLLMR